jgi:hypothetical protein
MCTLHAQSAGAVFDRIAALAQLADPPLPVEAAYQWTAAAITLIVHVQRLDTVDSRGRRSRRRMVTEIVEVGAVGDSGRPDSTVVFGPGPDGSPVPMLPPSPQLLARLSGCGFDWQAAQQPDGETRPRGYRAVVDHTADGDGWGNGGVGGAAVDGGWVGR